MLAAFRTRSAVEGYIALLAWVEHLLFRFSCRGVADLRQALALATVREELAMADADETLEPDLERETAQQILALGDSAPPAVRNLLEEHHLGAPAAIVLAGKRDLARGAVADAPIARGEAMAVAAMAINDGRGVGDARIAVGHGVCAQQRNEHGLALRAVADPREAAIVKKLAEAGEVCAAYMPG